MSFRELKRSESHDTKAREILRGLCEARLATKNGLRAREREALWFIVAKSMLHLLITFHRNGLL